MDRNCRSNISAILAIGSAIALTACGHAPEAQETDEVRAENDLAIKLNGLEERSYAAWRSGNTTFWSTFLADNFVGWARSGRLDKSGAERVFGGADCKIDSYQLIDNQVSELTPNAALLTHRTEVDGTCGGERLAPASYTATVYVRQGGEWKAAFRAQSAIVDPMQATQPAKSGAWTGGPSSDDAFTQTLLGREREVWSAWKDRDAERIDALLGVSIQFIDIFGNHLSTRPGVMNAWSGEGCDVNSFDLEGAQATMFTPDFGILTLRATTDGKCFGQDVWPIWGTSFYVKEDETWLWTSGINILAGGA